MAAAPQEVIELLIFTQLCLFLDALAYLKTMFKIQSFSKSCFQDFKITEYYRVLQSVTECYRVLQSVAEC